MYSPRRPLNPGESGAQGVAAARRALFEVFEAYTTWGGGTGDRQRPDRLTNANFMKMMRDAGLVSKKLTTTTLDLVWSRHTNKGRGSERTISFGTFEDVLVEAATRGNVGIDDMFATVTALKGPAVNSQFAEVTHSPRRAEVMSPTRISAVSTPGQPKRFFPKKNGPARPTADAARPTPPAPPPRMMATTASTTSSSSSRAHGPDDDATMMSTLALALEKVAGLAAVGGSRDRSAFAHKLRTVAADFQRLALHLDEAATLAAPLPPTGATAAAGNTPQQPAQLATPTAKPSQPNDVADVAAADDATTTEDEPSPRDEAPPFPRDTSDLSLDGADSLIA